MDTIEIVIVVRDLQRTEVNYQTGNYELLIIAKNNTYIFENLY